MNMRDAQNGRLLWESGDSSNLFEVGQVEAKVPSSILKCKAVSREINFTSTDMMSHFRLEQRVLFHG
jgi:retinal rod rhodopsin-sensitive cGMP 3',5'-cyclic phosphodiesterase subunit delta